MQKTIVEKFHDYDAQGTKHWNHETASHDLAYQVGNLAKAILQLEGKRFADGMDTSMIKERISDELADIMAEVLFIAHQLDIDLDAAWHGMLESDSKKINERTS